MRAGPYSSAKSGPATQSSSPSALRLRPPLIEELFPLKCSLKELEQFLDGSRKTACGWVGFYWGKPPDELRKSKKIGEAITLAWLELFQKKAKAMRGEP